MSMGVQTSLGGRECNTAIRVMQAYGGLPAVIDPVHVMMLINGTREIPQTVAGKFKSDGSAKEGLWPEDLRERMWEVGHDHSSVESIEQRPT